MRTLTSIFWNHTEKRLRAGWRIAGQQVLWVLLMTLIYPLFGSSAEEPLGLLLLELAAVGKTSLALLGSILIAARFLDKRPVKNLGLSLSPLWWADLGLGLGLGALLMALVFTLELSLGWIKIEGIFLQDQFGTPMPGRILVALLFFIAVGIYEELFSRGYLIKNLSEGLTGKVIQPRTAIILATLVSSLFFGMLHSINPNASPLGVLNICLAGFLLSAGYLYTGQLALPIGLHISWNFFLGSVFGFPVSGTLWQSGAVIRILQDGPERWTGGAFGPEGGLLGSLTILLGIGVIWFWKGRGKGIDLNLSHYERGRHLTESFPAITSSVLERIREVKHIIWDWNGTLLDDLDHCLDTINKMLSERNLPELTRDSYQNAFDFPVQDYYQRIGFDLDKESFETLSTEFIQAYEKGRPDCSLMDGAKEILSRTTRLGLSQSILSASKSGYLKEAVEAYDISGFFTIIQGQDNHHAAGKMDLAKAFLETCLLHPLELLLVGDTTHDSDIARELGINCILIPNGHQSRKRLENTGYPVIDSLVDLERILSKLASSR